MSLIFDVLSWFCFIAGGIFLVLGALGILRFPDLFTRMHAGGIIDTMGAYLILLGLAFQAGFTIELLKVVMIFFLLLVTSPTAAHALAKAAIAQGLKPVLHEEEGESSKD